MKSFILTLTVIAATTGLVMFAGQTAEAAPHGHAHGHANHSHAHHGHGHTAHFHGRSHHFSHYYGRGYNNWSRTTWNSRYGCNFYMSDNIWYYYCSPCNGYVPVTYINTYPPSTGCTSCTPPPPPPPPSTGCTSCAPVGVQ